MNRLKRIFLLYAVLLTCASHARAQSAEAEQLLLNWEKLNQLRMILQKMYDGYKILHQGYTAVRDLSEGNFSLHKTFLDGLLEVSPAVKNYRRISEIISYQVRIVREAKDAYGQLRQQGTFTAEELEYLKKVYDRLLRRSGEHLEELILVVTAGELRMSDDERLAAIDRLFRSIEDQYSFLRHFNGRNMLLSTQRQGEQAEVERSRQTYGF